MIQTSGTIRYSPKLLGIPSNKWWMVVDCDPEIGRYYRHLYNLFTYHCDVLMRAAWQEHITVIRNEEPKNKILWEKYAGHTINIAYNPVVMTHKNNGYYWLRVECPSLLDIREELGLERNPLIPLHLSVGHKYK